MVELIIGGVLVTYITFIIYFIERMRRFRRLPKEQRKKMSFNQYVLYLYGSYKPEKEDIYGTADTTLSTFRASWKEMEDIFHKLGLAFEGRKKELQEAEQSLTSLQQSIQEQDKRLEALRQLTPEAAQEVIDTIKGTTRTSLRQQIIISAVFFVLGVVTTLGVTLLI